MLDLTQYMAQRATETATATPKKKSNRVYFAPQDNANTPLMFRFLEVSELATGNYVHRKFVDAPDGTRRAHHCKVVCNGESLKWDVAESKFQMIIDECIKYQIDPNQDFALFITEGAINEGWNYQARKTINEFNDETTESTNDKIIQLPTIAPAPIESTNDPMIERAKSEMEKMRELVAVSQACNKAPITTAIPAPEARVESTQATQPATTTATPEIAPDRVEMPQSPADRDALITNAINRFMGSGVLTVPLTMHSYLFSVMRHLAYNSPDIYTSILAGSDDEYGKQFITVLKNHLSNPAIQGFNDTQKWNFLTVDINALLAKIAA